MSIGLAITQSVMKRRRNPRKKVKKGKYFLLDKMMQIIKVHFVTSARNLVTLHTNEDWREEVVPTRNTQEMVDQDPEGSPEDSEEDATTVAWLDTRRLSVGS